MGKSVLKRVNVNVKSDASFSSVHLQVVSITTTRTTTTPTSPLASSSLSQVLSSLWEWASTTAWWHKRRKTRRGKRGRNQRRSEPPCWLLPVLQNRTRRLSRWRKLPRWTRTRCRKRNQNGLNKDAHTSQKHTRELQQPHVVLMEIRVHDPEARGTDFYLQYKLRLAFRRVDSSAFWYLPCLL